MRQTTYDDYTKTTPSERIIRIVCVRACVCLTGASVRAFDDDKSEAHTHTHNNKRSTNLRPHRARIALRELRAAGCHRRCLRPAQTSSECRPCRRQRQRRQQHRKRHNPREPLPDDDDDYDIVVCRPGAVCCCGHCCCW